MASYKVILVKILVIGANGSLSMCHECHSASDGLLSTNKLIYWVPTQPMLDMVAFQNDNSKCAPKQFLVALWAISTTMQLEGQPSPLDETQKTYPKMVIQLLEGYWTEAPAPEPKLAVLVTVPN